MKPRRSPLPIQRKYESDGLPLDILEVGQLGIVFPAPRNKSPPLRSWELLLKPSAVLS